MIRKIEVRNFPYLGNLTIDCLSEIEFFTCNYEEEEYITTNLVIIEEDSVINGFDILSLFLCSLTMNMKDVIKPYFRSENSYIYIDYVNDGMIYRYSAVITNEGFKKETLHEVVFQGDRKDGTTVYNQITLKKPSAISSVSAIPLFHDGFFHSLLYFSYIIKDDSKILKKDIDLGKYTSYFEMINDGCDEYDNYISNLIDIIRKLGVDDLHDIVQTPDGYQVYHDDDEGEYLLLHEESELFVNCFFLGVCLLEALFKGKILFVNSVDKYRELLAKRAYMLFLNSEINTLGAQLFMSCYPTLLERIEFSNRQVFRTNKTQSQ